MSLNIKNERTYRLARELASLIGESVTAAVTAALEDRISCIRSARGPHQLHPQRIDRRTCR